jgi:ATP adenylyltransferase
LKVDDCPYCCKNSTLKSLMVEIAELRMSSVYLLKNQSFKGRCVIALNDHKQELFELSDQQRVRFFEEVASVAKAVAKLFHPDKLNYAVFGDTVPHFHIHLVPKYKAGPLWGKAFCEEPVDPVFLPEQELAGQIKSIREAISA